MPFHNIIINPGTTSCSDQNPGYSLFKIDDLSLIPKDLSLTFLPLYLTYNQNQIPDLSDLPFRTMKLNEFELYELTSESLAAFMDYLRNSPTENVISYLIQKTGYDPNLSGEREIALKLLKSVGLISDNEDPKNFLCQMHSSLFEDELTECMNSLSQSFLAKMLRKRPTEVKFND